MRIFHILNDCSATWHPSFLVWGGVRAMTGELRPRNCRLLSPKTLRVLCHRLLGILFNYSGRGTYNQATPRLLNAWNFESRSSTISFLYLLGLEQCRCHRYGWYGQDHTSFCRNKMADNINIHQVFKFPPGWLHCPSTN